MSVAIHEPETITITEAAAQHIERYMEKAQAPAMLLSLKKSGCSGWKYKVEPATTEAFTDNKNTKFMQAHAVLIIPSKDLPNFIGLKIDYVKDQHGLNKKLVFDNPHAEHMCGCGESFSLKEE